MINYGGTGAAAGEESASGSQALASEIF